MGKANSIEKMSKKIKIDKNNCWVWQGSLSKSGYGKSSYQDKSWRSHRLMFYFYNGFVPSIVMHSCDNRACVNPNHLKEGTHRENMIDMVKKGRSSKPKGTHHSQSRFRDEDIILMRKYYEDGYDLDFISRKYSTHKEYIRQIVNRKRWSHI